MSILRVIFGDQLSRDISTLRDVNMSSDVIFMAEVREEATSVRHHKQKIVLVLSAMRHFAESLRRDGLTVDYIPLDAAGNTGLLTGEVDRALSRHGAERIIVTEPSEWRVREMIRQWDRRFSVPVEVRDDDRFITTHEEFAHWAGKRTTMRMEHFYHDMRRRTGFLMDGDVPEGGRWNYDPENRSALPKDVSLPTRLRVPPDAVTRDVMDLVTKYFPNHFGDLDHFAWAVTRRDALATLRYFISRSLPQFGIYQDAMKTGEDTLFHSLLSPYLNIGLLGVDEVCRAACDACEHGDAPIQSTEGFIRQVIGWREFIRGIYWMHMPDYRRSNFFAADRPLPDFYWTAETDMACMRETITATRRNAYAHHIQRLMVTGNFALLAGLDPAQVEAWYLAVYADAFEWVELPNTHGMALYADGGILASKPYAASGAYINRMSDYCSGCRYSPIIKNGPGACPFNYLYWYFLISHDAVLAANPRMALPYRALTGMTEEHRRTIVQDAEWFLSQCG